MEKQEIFNLPLKREMKKIFLLIFFGIFMFYFIPFVSSTSANVSSFQTYYIRLAPTSATNWGYLPFTGGQTSTNAVPFVTMNLGEAASTTADYWNKYVADVYFNTTGIIINRSSSTATTMALRINVVQFNSNSVKVQSGVFSINSASVKNAYAVIPTPVNLSATALVFYYNSSDTTDDWVANSIRGYFVNTTYINLTMASTAVSGVKTGHWYAFESLDGGFTVQNTTVDLTDTGITRLATINSVNTAKTFLIASYTTTEDSDDARDGSFSINLTNSTTINSSRLAAATSPGQINGTAFAITFNGRESVQRGSCSYAAAAGTAAGVISSVNTSITMGWNPVTTGRMAEDSATVPTAGAFELLNITNSTGITCNRNVTVGNARGDWEVVQWASPDITTPNWSSNMTNSTTAGRTILHSVLWTEDEALSGYIFSFNNGSGIFVNDSWVAFTGTTNWSNVSKFVNSTENSIINWTIYANNSYNLLNVTGNFNYTTTAAPTDSCTCTDGASWTIINGDQCTLSSTCNLGTNPVRIMSGALRIASTGILNAQGCYVQDYQDLYVINGGKLTCRS